MSLPFRAHRFGASHTINHHPIYILLHNHDIADVFYAPIYLNSKIYPNQLSDLAEKDRQSYFRIPNISLVAVKMIETNYDF